MYYYEVAPLKIVRSGADVFTYCSDDTYAKGALVTIPVGKQTLAGVVIKEVSQPKYATKPIASLVDTTPLPAHLVKLSLWMSQYYMTPLATVLQTVLPRGVTKKRRVGRDERNKHDVRDEHDGHNARDTTEATPVSVRKRTKIILNDDQREAVNKIMDTPHGTLFLHGVTGSGKTEVYKEIARATLAQQKSVIVLVPEISLTSQLVDEFTAEFAHVLVTHSHMTEAERHRAWLQALHATEPLVIIGPRSALFMPVSQLGLIVVDEAHEPSYKQEQAPRYSALRAASVIAAETKARAIFGSATPLVADYYAATTQHVPIITLPRPARRNTTAPTIHLIDMKKRDNFKHHRFLSDALLKEIEHNLASKTENGGAKTKRQTLIFHNRRGSASTTLCENCGWTAECPRCFVPLVLHADSFSLVCHICGYTEKAPTSCPVCHEADIIHKGIGTKLIESELRRLFPTASIARFDGDTALTDTVDKRYQELYDGDIDIAIGTQVVAKGLDLPQLRTVGVIQADSGLSLPDYGAHERTFQLLAQVIGRVGRDKDATSVIIQTYQPTHPAITDGIAQNYAHFYENTLAERKKAGFPPFRYLLQLTDSYKTEAAAIKNAKLLTGELRKKMAAADASAVTILGPTPAFYERQRDTYRWQLLVKSPRRNALTMLVADIPANSHWRSELDPVSLL